MKVIITCGGTGGHITPALAIADMLRANMGDCKIRFLGTEGGMENTLVAAAGYEIHPLRVLGFSRKNPFLLLRSVRLMRGAIRTAKRELVGFLPDIVIGTGSYACYPALAAAISLGIPAAVHESNAVPGLAVRMLATRLSRVWLGFEAAKSALPSSARTLVVGNPQPRGFFKTDLRSGGRGERKTVLSFGGSLGAPAINAAILRLMEKTKEMGDVYHVHATGKREWEHFSDALEKKGLAGAPNLEILPFITDMPRRMREATVVVSRAGAMSISEIAMAGRAAVLVPSPNVTGDHQLKNAAALAEKGAAVLVEERELEGGALEKAVIGLLENGGKRRSMEEKVSAFAHPQANRLIYEDILRLVARK